MPKEPIKYENTIIYKIICLIPDINNIYVGITTDMIRRKYYHKVKSMDPKNNKYKLYHFINQHGGFNNFDIIEIKKISCMNNNQAKAQQYKYIKLLNADLNSNNVITKTNNVKTFFSDENNHRVINITKARKVKQNNDIKRQEKQQQLINKNKEAELYNKQLQKIKEEKKEIKRQIFLQQELNELNNLKKHLNKNKPVIQPVIQITSQAMNPSIIKQHDRFNTTCFFEH
jgi:hypothetical protein